MIDAITYFSTNNYDPKLKWLDFIILPNGKLWDVRFSGATEEEAKQKAIALYNEEKAKWAEVNMPKTLIDPWAGVKSEHHFVNTIWVIHKDTREKKRIPLTEISMYEKNGWERGGPRSK